MARSIELLQQMTVNNNEKNQKKKRCAFAAQIASNFQKRKTTLKISPNRNAFSKMSRRPSKRKVNTHNIMTDISEEAFHLRIGYLKPETLEIARTELRETDEIKAEAIVKLRELLKASPELNFKDDDAFLVVFLRACHFYPESALEKVCIASEVK